MGIVFYGTKQTSIDVAELTIICSHCGVDCMTDIMVISQYYHLYWIPMFPFEKLASTTCQKCGMFRSDLYFTGSLVSNYEEIKDKFRHPWFTYSGAGIFTFAVIIAILSNISFSS